jgi:glycosyltransferase involved in cell wall biosynthesis
MVHFIHSVPNVAPLLLQTDVLVMPSRWEACPILTMEALVLGVPIIGSYCLGLREVLRGTPDIVIPKENPEALANALVAFVENPKPFFDAAKNYVVEATKRFDVNVAAEQTIDRCPIVAPRQHSHQNVS